MEQIFQGHPLASGVLVSAWGPSRILPEPAQREIYLKAEKSTITVYTREDMAEVVRLYAGTESEIHFGTFSIRFHSLSYFDKLEFFVRLGQMRDPAKSKRDWWTGSRAIAAEGPTACPPRGYDSFEHYLTTARPSRNWFIPWLEKFVNHWQKLPRKDWPKV